MDASGHVPVKDDGVIRPSFERVDDRGVLREVLNSGRWECLLSGEMKAQAVMGNHYHKKTNVFFFLTSGRADVTSVHMGTGSRRRYVLRRLEGILLKPHVAHAIRFEEDSSFIMLKSVRYDSADPDTFPHRVV